MNEENKLGQPLKIAFLKKAAQAEVGVRLEKLWHYNAVEKSSLCE